MNTPNALMHNDPPVAKVSLSNLYLPQLSNIHILEITPIFLAPAEGWWPPATSIGALWAPTVTHMCSESKKPASVASAACGHFWLSSDIFGQNSCYFEYFLDKYYNNLDIL